MKSGLRCSSSSRSVRATARKLPLPRDCFEGVPCFIRLDELLELARLGGIDPTRYLLSQCVSDIASGFQTHIRIDSERNSLLNSANPVFQPEPFSARWGDFQVHSLFVV